MATRIESFFDQDHNKPRPNQWNPNHHSRQPLKDASTNTPLSVKPAIPATSEANSKLKAFDFVADENETPHDDTEHGDMEINGNGKDAKSAKDTQHSTSSTHQIPSIPPANTFPCTPGARLPLEDLIGNVDEVKGDELVKLSPQEQIGWIPNSSSDLLTPNRKKRRRAKSSSPTCPGSSSQPNQTSIRREPTSDLKTPAADPVADLWQRYANSKHTGETLKLPEISSLIFQASPRPLETPVKDGKLRRWASTGNDWPSSKNKRLCTNSRTSINVWQDHTAIESGSRSKVATMVQKMQETLASQRLEQVRNETPTTKPLMEAPSSSSPLPDAGTDFGSKTRNTSPLQTRRPAIPAQASRPPLALPDLAHPRPKPQLQRTQSGGIRYDHSRVVGDPWNASAAPTYTLQSKAPLPAYKRPSVTRPPLQPKAQQVPLPPPKAVKNGQGEFDDDDFDLTADDLDELCSQVPLCHRSLHEIPPYPDPPPRPQPAATIQQPTILIDDDDDEFGGEEIDEASFAQAEFSATQARRISPRKRKLQKSPSESHWTQSGKVPTDTAPNRLQRYVVRHVADTQSIVHRGHITPERVLVVEDERSRRTVSVTLSGSWSDTVVTPNTIIHIARLRHQNNQPPTAGSHHDQDINVSDAEGSPLLIVHPDHMLSATTVADSFDCVRKAVLQDRIKATGETNQSMVYGKILHEIFQQCLSANQWNQQFLDDVVESTVQAHVEGLWELGMQDTVKATEDVKAKMGELAAWAGIFVKSEPSAASTVDDRQGEKVLMSISRLIAIEEHVWSPRFGLKGNIDATIQVTTTSHPGAPDLKNFVAPFEVKTGRTTHSAAHRAQTALYTLLLSDRYDVVVEAGILYYLESSSMSRIAPTYNEIKQMVQQRNRLASYIHRARNPARPDADANDMTPPMASQAMEESGLPNLLRNPFKCGRCYAQESCFSYHSLVEGGTSESAGMIDDRKKDHSVHWNEAIGHLQLENKNDIGRAETLKRWFTKWDKLLTFEESDQSRLRKELWTMSSSEREAAGRCLGNLVLSKDLTHTSIATQGAVDGIEGSGGKINRYAYSFARANVGRDDNFTEDSQLTIGEPVVVSSEQGQWALANGYVVALSQHEITVAIDRKLGDARTREADFHERSNQVFRGTMVVDGRGPVDMPMDVSSVGPESQMRYRVDKDEFSNGLALVRNSLVRFMGSHPIHTRLREMIIFNAAPQFGPGPALGSVSSAPTCDVVTKSPERLGAMNEDQEHAVDRVLAAKDYALILGMPGTGKTTTIAHIIRALLAEEKSILLTSFTHTAVDNILLKIRDVAPHGAILRLGVSAKINTQVQEFCKLAATPRQTIGEVDDAFMGSRIVATTCMGINHALFNRRSFDVCIVDEASQITLPTILGPLLHARKFVLVGDHYQLPPLVQNKAALAGGLDVSLFRQLSENQPNAVVDLGRQYRMSQDIMSLSNELVYHGKLRCGNEEVANRTLTIRNTTALDVYHRGHSSCPNLVSMCWLHRITNPQHKVVFANTVPLGKRALETLSAGGKITNNVEAALTAQSVLGILALGVPGSQVGVITLYRSQLALMRQLFRRARIPESVEIDSADRFQGRDKECIILSMVRSNEVGIVGDLLKDWRRVNVALTRARSKLIVFGNQKTLKHNELLEKMLEMMSERRWIFDLPADADDNHSFDFSTQVAEELMAKQSASPKKKGRISPRKTSPTKRGSPEKVMSSPSKTTPVSTQSISKKQRRGALCPSASAANRGSRTKSGDVGQGGTKIIRGIKAGKLKQQQEQIWQEVMDLTGDD